jgi:ubiquinone/menaquinone biosynthesis C-methylase UbiE
MNSALECCDIICCKRSQTQSSRSLDARVSQRDIGAVYDKLSRVYDIWSTLTESRARARAIELAEIQDGQSILEVAVGTGHAFLEMVKRNPRGTNTGIDLSDGMLEKAKQRLSKLPDARYTLSKGTAFDLSTASGSVDLLVNNYMFDLIAYEDMDKVLAEFKWVLKKGGKLVLVNMTIGESIWTRVYNLVYRLYPKAIGGCRGLRLTEKLKEQGFIVETREYYHQML